MKTKQITVCNAIRIDIGVKYPYSHKDNSTIGYYFIVNPDYVDRISKFAIKCVELNRGKGWVDSTSIKEDYPVSQLKEYYEIRDSIFEEVEDVMDEVEKIWNSTL